MLVSGIQQIDLVIHMHFFLFQIFLQLWILQDIEECSLCYTVAPCLLSILYIVACVC